MPEFQDGIAAYKAGKRESKNPYKAGKDPTTDGIQHTAWLAGWNDIVCEELIKEIDQRIAERGPRQMELFDEDDQSYTDDD